MLLTAQAPPGARMMSFSPAMSAKPAPFASAAASSASAAGAAGAKLEQGPAVPAMSGLSLGASAASAFTSLSSPPRIGQMLELTPAQLAWRDHAPAPAHGAAGSAGSSSTGWLFASDPSAGPGPTSASAVRKLLPMFESVHLLDDDLLLAAAPAPSAVSAAAAGAFKLSALDAEALAEALRSESAMSVGSDDESGRQFFTPPPFPQPAAAFAATGGMHFA